MKTLHNSYWILEKVFFNTGELARIEATAKALGLEFEYIYNQMEIMGIETKDDWEAFCELAGVES